MLARVTVTDLATEVSMTATEVARLGWCVGVTTVSSSVPTSTPRTTAANTRTAVEAGASGEPGVAVRLAVAVGSGAGTGSARAPGVLTPRPRRPGYVTPSPALLRDINTNTRALTITSLLNILENINMVSINLVNIIPDNLYNITPDNPYNITPDNLDNISPGKMDRITTANTISKITTC